ncbi:hypothetical protein RCH14_000451 [Massilia sp. MP_M2]|uniref:hypothetical protein n=1 Tax=Massilia sp. MP_M2 TaxID=3071713 RepID=UPI00319E3937
MEHAHPRRTASALRTWSLCMTSENHGTVGPAGCKFSHAPEKHERVLVVEVPAAAGAPVDQVNLQLVGARRPVAEFKGYVDGQPAVTWLDRDNMPCVGTKLYAAPLEVKADQAAAPLPAGPVRIADIPSIEITLRQAKELVATFGGHDAEISIFQRPAAWADMDDGLYAFFSDYPDEGSMYLGPTDVDDDLAMNGEPAPAEPTDEMIVAALHACAIDTSPSIYGFPELQVSATNVPGIRAVYMKIAAAMQASTSGERQEGGAA